MVAVTAQHVQYHTDKDAKYVLPNHPEEQDRLNEQAIRLQDLMNDRVIHAPITLAKGQTVLDVGCGTGFVTDYIAARFPEAEAYGVDLTAVPGRPTASRPSNVSFFQGNFITQEPHGWKPLATHGPSLPENAKFDYIFSRLLIGGMTDWPGFVRREFELLAPGGWVELHEIDYTFYDRNGNVLAPAAERTADVKDDRNWDWYEKFAYQSQKVIGLDFAISQHLPDLLRSAGFVDVHVQHYRWPLGTNEAEPNLRRFGEYSKRAMPEIYDHVVTKVMPAGTPPEEIEQIRKQAVACVAADDGSYWRLSVFCARKA